MTAALLQVEGLVKRFAGLLATDHFSLEVGEGELVAVIGPNGAGKTTLIAQLSGELAPDEGRILFAGRDVTRLPVHARAAMGLARSFQITSIFPELTVLQNVALAVQVRSGHSMRFWGAVARDRSLADEAATYLEEVGLAQRADVLAANVSHGEKRALEIAIALASRPRLLLLDEPMAGMGPDESARMIKLLSRVKRRFSTILVEHDMEAVFALADRVAVLVSGRIIAVGAPDDIRDDPAVRAAYLGEEVA
ncbi:MAG: branched-chain amino acid transporter substrate-binding protein [Ramlibacter sp.]|jgi:branched-chain amino acid transport system ATP-binding protein|nr:branched-chain amino acid transporter substrate-binding protein [Ramlibacter sp.]